MTIRILFAILLLTAGRLVAQDEVVNDPAAQSILDRVAEKYRTASAIEAEVELTMYFPETDQPEIQSIDLESQGEKFRVEVAQDVYLSDGVTMWTYMGAIEEVTIYDYDPNDQLFAPARLFGFYDEDYIYAVQERTGDEVTLVLVPVDKGVEFFKIYVTIDEATDRITRTEVLERSGMRYVMDFESVDLDASVADDRFVFDRVRDAGGADIFVTDMRD